jgi:ADP-ribose pyrophosphatase YjhB (NUDIX family)
MASKFIRFATGVHLFYSCLRRYVMAVGFLAVCVIATSFAMRIVSPRSFQFFMVCIIVPACAAVLVVSYSLLRSGYLSIVIEYGLKRMHAPTNQAGLGFLRSVSNKVLLNLQDEAPWAGMWILPGGYFNPAKNDMSPADTVRRRALELTGAKDDLIAGAHIACTNFNHEYIQAMLEFGHVPTRDHVHLVVRHGLPLFKEDEIQQTNVLRWVSADEIENGVCPVPPHMKELLLFILANKHSGGRVKYWILLPDYAQYYLPSLHLSPA